MIAEIEERYAFVGGTYEQYLLYYHRADLPPGMWRFRPMREARAISGFSATPKKDPSQQRKLLMACSTNAQWVDPKTRRRLGLHGAAAFSQLAVPGDSWDISVSDANNAFTRVEMPAWMHPWFACPPVPAAAVWSLLDAELQSQILPSEPIAPQHTRLAMGSAHAVLILMPIGLCASARALRASSCLTASAVASSASWGAYHWCRELRAARRCESRVLIVAAFVCDKPTMGNLVTSLRSRCVCDAIPHLILEARLDRAVDSVWLEPSAREALMSQADDGDWDVLVADLGGWSARGGGHSSSFWKPGADCVVPGDEIAAQSRFLG